jgi:glycosyltransferase involved in cell wall biosynthesis
VAGDAAILFDPRIPKQIAQAILDLAGDQALRARMIEAGHLRARLFEDSGIMAQEYRELFEYAVADRQQDRRPL